MSRARPAPAAWRWLAGLAVVALLAGCGRTAEEQETRHRFTAMGTLVDVTIWDAEPLAAEAAALQTELSVPEICQTVILTRTAMRSSKMPQGEELSTQGQSGATLAIHLSVRNIPHIQRELLPLPAYGED